MNPSEISAAARQPLAGQQHAMNRNSAQPVDPAAAQAHRAAMDPAMQMGGTGFAPGASGQIKGNGGLNPQAYNAAAPPRLNENWTAAPK